MAAGNIRVLVVDDSAVMRKILCDQINESPGMEVAGTAANGREAVERLDALRPDAITLDVQMPVMDGLAALDAILARRPTPVLMVSSMTRRGAQITLDSLERGALDYVAKPDYGVDARTALRDELLWKIRTIAGTDVRRILEIRRERKQRREEIPAPGPPKPVGDEAPAELLDKCIAIGISTGGPPALSRLFESLRLPMPPIVVVQHMPPSFTRPLAWRLDALSRLTIKEAEDGEPLRPNHVLIAPGGRHLLLRRSGLQVRAVLDDGPPVSSHKPSADALMKSAAEAFGSRCLGVVMTGMGRDGSDGCRAIRAAGGYVLGQDEATSDVYGMNKVAMVEGNVDRQFSLPEAAGTIGLEVRRLWCGESVRAGW